MNSSFYFPDFQKFRKSAQATFPLYNQEPVTANPSHPPEESSLGVAGNFSPLVGVNSVLAPLNTDVTSTATHPDRWVQTAIEEALRKKLVVEETAKFFREKVPSPEFFGTVTHDKDVRKDSATKIFLEYLRNIAQRFGSHFRVAWGGGYQANRIAYHTHFLVSRIPNEAELVPPLVAADDLMGLWHYGISEVEPYDLGKGSRDRGAAYYIANHEDTDVWVACTRTKRCKGPGGCKVERSIW